MPDVTASDLKNSKTRKAISSGIAKMAGVSSQSVKILNSGGELFDTALDELIQVTETGVTVKFEIKTSSSSAAKTLAKGIKITPKALKKLTKDVVKGTTSACGKVAEDSKKEVKDICSTGQKELNRLPRGKSCCQSGQPALNQAKSHLSDTESQLSSCKGKLNDLENTPVKFKSTAFKKLKNGKCGAFFNSRSYKDAKQNVEDQQKKCNTLKGKIEAYKKSVKDAKGAQKRSIQRCVSNKAKNINTAFRSARKNCNSKKNKKGWKRASTMLCVLNNISIDKCEVSSLPKITKPKVGTIKCDAGRFSDEPEAF